MGYDMFRNLSNAKGKRFKGKMKEIFQKTLVDPGNVFIIFSFSHLFPLIVHRVMLEYFGSLVHCLERRGDSSTAYLNLPSS